MQIISSTENKSMAVGGEGGLGLSRHGAKMLWLEVQRRIVRLLMGLAPSSPRVNLHHLVASGSDSETRRAYHDEGKRGAGSFRGHFRLAVDEYITGRRVLDLGAGGGGRAAFWKHDLRAAKVVGIDIYPWEVAGAQCSVGRMGIAVSFCVGFGERLPFQAREFDTVLLSDVLEHVRDVRDVLRECGRVLIPGGILLAVFPPFYHPNGHHLSSVTNFPWLQFFDAEAVTRAFNDVVDARGEEAGWYRRGPLEPHEKLGWLNGLTIRKFRKLVRETDWRIVSFECLPLFRYGLLAEKYWFLRLMSWPIGLAARLPLIEEVFTHRVVCVLRKAPLT